MGSKLLITGGLGYIGSFTARKFQKINKFKGTPTSTIIAGNIKMQDGKILGDPDGKPLKFS